MDRRSWLWRRKSSEKSPGETESSGSVSSHSERFSDDQVYATHNSQSPEVTSKAAAPIDDDEAKDIVKSLKEKLSSALQDISAKEDLVKQHAKVAEEAVAGWEKAENEVSALKQKLEAAAKKNSSLEDRVGHLDGALKECVRQLRQGREEQAQKINEAIRKRTCEWESTKSELESQLIQLQAKLETTSAEADLNLHSKLEDLERANLSLKRELASLAEELKIRIIERDLSTQSAESASKQHLEDMRKIAKLEAECKRLKAIARKASTATDCKSFTASSVYVESFTDSQSDYGERILSVDTDSSRVNEISLMDDFLEMERLAGLPDTESESYYPEASPLSDKQNESVLKAELEAMIHRTAECEEKLEKMEEEKAVLEMSLSEHKKKLETSQGEVKEAELRLRALQAQLAQTSESKVSEIENLHTRIGSLEEELQRARDLCAQNLARCEKLEEELKEERASASETLAKCHKLEAEVLSMKRGVELQQEKELAVAASKFAECQKTIASLGRQLKSLATLEDFLVEEKSGELTLEELKSCSIEPHSPNRSDSNSKSQKTGNDCLSSPENSNDKELTVSLSVNTKAASERIQNGSGKRFPRGRSRFRNESSKD